MASSSFGNGLTPGIALTFFDGGVKGNHIPFVIVSANWTDSSRGELVLLLVIDLFFSGVSITSTSTSKRKKAFQ